MPRRHDIRIWHEDALIDVIAADAELVNLEDYVHCPACGFPVPRSLLRPIPPDGEDGVAPAPVCRDCLGLDVAGYAVDAVSD